MIPPAERHFKWGTQARRLYDFLACGPATGDRIARQTRVYNYHRVLAVIRRRLEGTGVTVKARPVDGRRRRWEYRLGTVKGAACPHEGATPDHVCPKCYAWQQMAGGER